MLKTLMLTTAAGGLMIGAALAEGSPPPASSPPPAKIQPAPAHSSSNMPATPAGAQFVVSQRADQWLASKFKGTDVLGTDNQKIGDVSDVLFDHDGKVEAYVISVGGFLGMGAKDVALAPSSFQIVRGDKSKNESDKLKLSMSKDELKQAANFEPYHAPRTTTGQATPGSTPSSTPRPTPMAPAPSK